MATIINNYPVFQPLIIFAIVIFIGLILWLIGSGLRGKFFETFKIIFVFILTICVFVLPIISIYSIIYGVSIKKSFVTIIVPIFKLFVSLINIFYVLLYLPYYIIITIWDVIKKIINILKYIYTLFNYLASLIYLTQNSLLS